MSVNGVAELGPAFFAGSIAGHVCYRRTESVADFSLAETAVPKLGHEMVDRSRQQREVGPGVGPMKSLQFLPDAPDSV